MTSSGTYNFALTAGEGVLAAFERCLIRSPELRQEHMVTARREANLLFVELANRQVNLFKVEQLSIDMAEGTPTYSVPGRVVMILDAYLTLNDGETDQTDKYLTPISRTEYASYAQKFVQGPPTVFWFNRLISPEVTMWPVPDGNGPYVLNYFACTQMQDLGLAGGETPDLPYRWLDVLVSGLAKRLTRCFPPQGGVDVMAFWKDKDAEYDRAWGIAGTQDTENVQVSIAPSLAGYYR